MQQQHKDVSIVKHYSDSCPIEYLWNGNHLLTHCDTSLLLHCFKIATANDSTFVDYYRNRIASSYYQFVSTAFELFRSLWRSGAIKSISRILFCVTVSNTFCGSMHGQWNAMLSACSLLSGFSRIVFDAILHVSVEYQVNTRFLNIPVGPSHCLVYIIVDFSKAWLIH